MTQTSHVRLDGEALFPEEPVDLSEVERLTVQLVTDAASATSSVHANSVEEKLRRMRRFARS